MELFSRVIILAACVLAAYALPAAVDVFQPSEHCDEKFHHAQRRISEEISLGTEKCIRATEVALNRTIKGSEADTIRSRNSLKTLEQNLHNCTKNADDMVYVSCVTSNSDKNEKLLASGDQVAEMVQDNISAQFSKQIQVQENCIDVVFDKASKNFTKITDDYRKCRAVLDY